MKKPKSQKGEILYSLFSLIAIIVWTWVVWIEDTLNIFGTDRAGTLAQIFIFCSVTYMFLKLGDLIE